MPAMLWYLYPKPVGYAFSRFDPVTRVRTFQRKDGTWGAFEPAAVKPLWRPPASPTDPFNANLMVEQLPEPPEGAATVLYPINPATGLPDGQAFAFAPPGGTSAPAPIGQGVLIATNMTVNLPAGA